MKKGFYSKQLLEEIGEGAYNHDGHRNAMFLDSKRIGPYPTACRQTWEHLRLDAAYIYGLIILSSLEEGGKLGPLAHLTPANIKNRGAAERKKPQQGTTTPSPVANPAEGRQATDEGASSATQANIPTAEHPGAASFPGASQWPPCSIAELEETEEHSDESDNLAEAVAQAVEEAYTTLHHTETN